jgi:hypothetical protein
MFRAYLVTALLILAGLAIMIAPVFVDARHWWPRKRKKGYGDFR